MEQSAAEHQFQQVAGQRWAVVRGLLEGLEGLEKAVIRMAVVGGVRAELDDLVGLLGDLLGKCKVSHYLPFGARG